MSTLHVADRALELHLFVPIRPKGQGRPRFDPRSKRAYTPKATRDYVHAVRAAALAVWGERAPLRGALHVQVFATFALPKKGDGRVFHLQRPDLDNAVKAALDALNGAVFADDCQVVELTARKGWSVEGPGLTVRVWSLG